MLYNLSEIDSQKNNNLENCFQLTNKIQNTCANKTKKLYKKLIRFCEKNAEFSGITKQILIFSHSILMLMTVRESLKNKKHLEIYKSNQLVLNLRFSDLVKKIFKNYSITEIKIPEPKKSKNIGVQLQKFLSLILQNQTLENKKSKPQAYFVENSGVEIDLKQILFCLKRVRSIKKPFKKKLIFNINSNLKHNSFLNLIHEFITSLHLEQSIKKFFFKQAAIFSSQTLQKIWNFEQIWIDEIKKDKPKFILAGFFQKEFELGLACAAKKLNIPTISLQHCIYKPWTWEWVRWSDEVPFSYKIVSSRFSKQKIEDKKPQCKIRVGSLPFFLHERKIVNLEKDSVQYFLPSLNHGFMYFDNSRLLGNDCQVLSEQIISALLCNKAFKIYICRHPNLDHSLNFSILKKFYANEPRLIFVNDTSLVFSEYVIIDSPSSVLGKALASNAKVLVFNPIFKFYKKAKKMINEACFFYENLSTFIYVLQNLNKVNKKQKKQDKFLKCFFSQYYFDKKKSYKNLNKILKSIVHESQI